MISLTGRGLVIQQDDELHVHFNAIHANHSDGVVVHQNAAVVLRSNSITSNHGTGIISTAPNSNNQLVKILFYILAYHSKVVGLSRHLQLDPVSQNDFIPKLILFTNIGWQA